MKMEAPGEHSRGYRIFYVMDFGEGPLEYNQLVYGFSQEQAERDFWVWYRTQFGRQPAKISRVEVEA